MIPAVGQVGGGNRGAGGTGHRFKILEVRQRGEFCARGVYRQIIPVALLHAAVGLHAHIVNRVVGQIGDLVECVGGINRDGVIVPGPVRGLVLQNDGGTGIGIMPGNRHVGDGYRSAGKLARGKT